MNRFLRGRRAAPWAWMLTGPLTVDAERLAAEAAEQIPASARTPPTVAAEPAVRLERDDVVDQPELQLSHRQGTALAVPLATRHSGVSTPEGSELAVGPKEAEPAAEDTKLTLDDFPSLKAAMESFEKRGDPIMIRGDDDPSDAEPECAPKRRTNAKPRKSRSKRIVKGVNLRPHPPKRNRIPATEPVSAENAGHSRPPKTQAEIDLSHHERHCTLCHHPEREAIEEAFCQWRNVRFIARDFNVAGGPSTLYRHAHALKLFKQRNLTLRSSLEFVIEQSERIVPTAEGLVKAIRAYTRINDAGEWIDTPTTHIVKVIAMHSADAGSHTNTIPGLTLDVSRVPSDKGRVGLTIESASPQQLLPGTAPRVENTVTD